MRDAIPHDAIVAAINLAPHIRAVREELETTRRVPLSLAQAINDAGLFRPYLPHALGGLELPPLTVFRVIEEISKVDGSVGWCTMIASSESLLSGWLHPSGGPCLGNHPTCAWPARYGLKARPIRSTADIASGAAGTLRVVLLMPTGSSARVPSWMGTLHGRPPPVCRRSGRC